MRKTLAVVATSGIILFAPAAVASAEPVTAGVGTVATATDVESDDKGDKTGLWGLLGLLGLAGLAKRKVRDDDHRR